MFDKWLLIFTGNLAPTPLEGKVMLAVIAVLLVVCLWLEWRLIRQKRQIKKLMESSPDPQVNAIKPSNH